MKNKIARIDPKAEKEFKTATGSKSLRESMRVIISTVEWENLKRQLKTKRRMR